MINHIARPCATLALALTVISTARGQTDDWQRPGALSLYGGSSGTIWLVRIGPVRRELRLTKEQAAKADELCEELRAESRRLFAGTIGGQGPEHQRRIAQCRKRDAALTVDFNRQTLKLLTESQARRLNELYIRFLGPRALFAPRIVARLKIDDGQQKALADAVRDGKRSLEPLLKILNRQQRRRFEQMCGAPFEFPQPKLLHLRQR